MNWKQVSACHQWVCDGEMLLLCTGLLTMAAGWKLFRLWLAVWLAVTALAFYTAIQYRRLPQEGRRSSPAIPAGGSSGSIPMYSAPRFPPSAPFSVPRERAFLCDIKQALRNIPERLPFICSDKPPGPRRRRHGPRKSAGGVPGRFPLPRWCPRRR